MGSWGRNRRLQGRARELRNAPSPYEARLWKQLSGAKAGGFKFRRQAPLPPFIVDFLCPEIGLIVEVDGDTHDAEQDMRRDALLAERGFITLRFTNHDLRDNLEGVIAIIVRTAETLPTRFARAHPNPSRKREGL